MCIFFISTTASASPMQLGAAVCPIPRGAYDMSYECAQAASAAALRDASTLIANNERAAKAESTAESLPPAPDGDHPDDTVVPLGPECDGTSGTSTAQS